MSLLQRVTALALLCAAVGRAASAADHKPESSAPTLANDAIAAVFELNHGVLRLASLRDLRSGETLAWDDPNLFSLQLSPRGKPLSSSGMKRIDGPRTVVLHGDSKVARASERLAGRALCATFEDAGTGLRVQWRAVLRDGSHYLRQELAVTASRPTPVVDIEMIRVRLPRDARLDGYTDGSPVVCGRWFLGIEHPMAKTTVEKAGGAARAVSVLPRHFTLKPGNIWRLSTGIGVTPPGQLRRGFARYIERERAHPYRQFWHYNSWYDLNIDRNDSPDPMKRMNEGQCEAVIRAFERELFEKRGVALDGFLWDDGWDDWNSLWKFHKGFPNGFAKLNELAKRQGAVQGAWLSPWGGYGHSHEMRVARGKAHGYETNPGGFSLGGPKYYAAFRDTCITMIRDNHLGCFKFDGIGTGTWSTGAPAKIAPDLDGLVRLIGELRWEKPDVFINCTVGTWASPYWVFFADSIWRQGEDTGFSGKGNPRERWINYKDSIVYERFASRSPLFPLNSLMYHGLCVGPRGNPGKMPPPAKDLAGFRHEVQMVVAYSSGLGELYITPSLMTPEAWDALAEGIAFARAKRDVMVDSHWVGGNPGKNEVYGIAAWHPRQGGVLTLRNPDDRPRTIALKLADTFELPGGSPARLRLQSPWKAADRKTIETPIGEPASFTLRPFDVLTLDAQAVK